STATPAMNTFRILAPFSMNFRRRRFRSQMMSRGAPRKAHVKQPQTDRTCLRGGVRLQHRSNGFDGVPVASVEAARVLARRPPRRRVHVARPELRPAERRRPAEYPTTGPRATRVDAAEGSAHRRPPAGDRLAARLVRARGGRTA